MLVVSSISTQLIQGLHLAARPFQDFALVVSVAWAGLAVADLLQAEHAYRGMTQSEI